MASWVEVAVWYRQRRTRLARGHQSVCARVIAVAWMVGICFTALAVLPAEADTKRKTPQKTESNDIPQVPDDQIFGFTSPTGVGEVGEKGFATELDGRLTKRDGSYNGFNSKSELGYTFAKDWWIGGSFFGGWDRIKGVAGFRDVNIGGFDGLSFELQHVFITRSADNPFAAAFAIEPRWARFDPVAGLRSETINAAVKLLVDAIIVPDRIFWAANFNWVPQTAQNDDDRRFWISTSTSLISTALTFQLSKTLFVGAEARHLGQYDTGTMRQRLGYAIYVGPTLAWKLTDKIIFNATWQPQVSGRSSSHYNLRYDLDNFERTQFRAKISMGLD